MLGSGNGDGKPRDNGVAHENGEPTPEKGDPGNTGELGDIPI